MKKVSILVLAFVFVFAFGSRHLSAQVSEMDLYVNVGILTDDSFTFDPFFWSAGANMDIKFGRMLMFSPECDVIFKKFKFKRIWLAPGAVLNVRYGLFFAGAGLRKWFKISKKGFNTDILMKINAGFKGHKYRLAAYLETPFDDFFGKNMVTFGATLGFKF